MVYWLEQLGNLLQWVLPSVTVIDDIRTSKNSTKAFYKGLFLALFIAFQNRVVHLIKILTKKPRPAFPNDLESFPSGHTTIAAIIWMRLALKYGFRSWQSLTTGGLVLVMGASRYFPGKHDLIDIAAGVLFGALFGWIWHLAMKKIDRI